MVRDLESTVTTNTLLARSADLQRQGLVAIVAGSMLLAAACGTSTQRALLANLKEQGGSGLALVRLRTNFLYLQTFDGPSQASANPRGLSSAWFSSGGKAAVWTLYRGPDKQDPSCPFPAVAEILGEAGAKQIPGNLINVHAMSVSSDGSQAAFDGLFKPGKLGDASQNHASTATGLQYVNLRTGAARLILALSDAKGSERVTSISFSADGAQFVYDYKGQIFVYQVASGRARAVADGSGPTWSPNGRWIAYRDTSGVAMVLDASTFRPENVIGRDRIDTSPQWSPDSRYVMVTVPAGFASSIFHGWNPLYTVGEMVVERIGDGASVVVDRFDNGGISPQGFYWIPDSVAFLRQANTFPGVQACGGGF